MTDGREYQSVIGAKARCRDRNNSQYANYGGRGIEYRLPENPREAVAALVSAIGPRPEGTSLDRIDNDGHYELDNVRWATPSEQVRNR